MLQSKKSIDVSYEEMSSCDDKGYVCAASHFPPEQLTELEDFATLFQLATDASLQ
jgi:hypothetical protein